MAPPVLPVQGQSIVALAKGGGGPDTAHTVWPGWEAARRGDPADESACGCMHVRGMFGLMLCRRVLS